MYGFAVGDGRLEAVLPGNRAHDIYGARPADQRRLQRHQKPAGPAEERPTRHVHARRQVFVV